MFPTRSFSITGSTLWRGVYPLEIAGVTGASGSSFESIAPRTELKTRNPQRVRNEAPSETESHA